LDSAQVIALSAVAFFVAGFVKGVIGAGLPTVSLGILGLLVTPAQAAAVLVAPSLVTNVWQFVSGGGLLALTRRLWPLLAGICIGTLVAALLLPKEWRGGTTLWLGVALAVYALFGLSKIRFSVPERAEVWAGLLAGFLTGVITIATAVFVIPGTPYMQALKFDRDKLVQAMGLSFTVSTVTLAAALGQAGELSPALLWPSFAALVAALVGMRLGQAVRTRISEKTFVLCFFAGLLVLGLHLAWRGL
jgi:uncharacterized membrane protein YfcA